MREPEQPPAGNIRQQIGSLASDVRKMASLRWELAQLELKAAAGSIKGWNMHSEPWHCRQRIRRISTRWGRSRNARRKRKPEFRQSFPRITDHSPWHAACQNGSRIWASCPCFANLGGRNAVCGESLDPLSHANTNTYVNRLLWRADCFLIRHSAGCAQIWQTISRMAQMGGLGRLSVIVKNREIPEGNKHGEEEEESCKEIGLG